MEKLCAHARDDRQPKSLSAVKAILLGGHVRVGLEDNLYFKRASGQQWTTVEKAVDIITALAPTLPVSPA